ncbi:hypothetical protein HEP87_58445 [Streptomyces sp. S1D4-11]
MNATEFRSDLRRWLDRNDLSPGPDHSLDGQVAQLARVRRALYEADWMRYGWPAEVGVSAGKPYCGPCSARRSPPGAWPNPASTR